MATSESKVAQRQVRAASGKKAGRTADSAKRALSARQPDRESISEEAVPYLLRQVAERLASSLTEVLRPFDQTPAVYRTLIALLRRNSLTVGELAEATLIEPSTLSRTVVRMEEQDLVSRSSGTADGRTISVEISDAGRRYFEEILPIASAQYEWSIRGVSTKNLATMQTTLKQMLANLKVSPIK